MTICAARAWGLASGLAVRLAGRLAGLCLRAGADLAAIVFAALLLAAAPVRAEIWAHVDAQGAIHFATHQVDERYDLFMRGGPTAESLQGLSGLALAPANPGKSGAPMSASGVPAAGVPTPFGAPPVDAPPQPARIPRLARFIEQSAVYQQVRGPLHDQARLRGVDVDLVKAVIAAESGFNPMAVSLKGAIGLMQLMPATAERWGVSGDARRPLEQRLTDSTLNLATGIRHLRHLIDLYPGRLDLALAAYNAGEGAVQRAGQRIPDFRETRDYVSTVLALYANLRAGAMPGVLGGAPAASLPAAQPRVRAALPTVPGRSNMPPSLLAGTPLSSNSLD